MFNVPHPLSYAEAVRQFLAEDWGTQDWSAASVPDVKWEAKVFSKSELTVAGLPIARQVFLAVDESLEVELLCSDGDKLTSGQAALRVHGSSRSILMAERVMLNLLQRMSGTATLTRAFVDAVSGTGARILDTRKTTPGLKLLEKYAVRCGGGFNHRINLGDGVLLKENHIIASQGIRPAVLAARENAPNLLRVEVEVESLEQLKECLQIPELDGVLLDNMSNDVMAEAVRLRNASARRLFLEASGNMSLPRVRGVAETGVDFISVGALTHSAPSVDLSMRFVIPG